MDRKEQSFSFCLCADDFALSPGVSRGIIEAFDAGRLSATSAMTSRPSWPPAAKELRLYRDKADIGLHLNLTLGQPLGPMPRVAPSGRFPEIAKIAKGGLLGALPRAEIRQEISRQIASFCQHSGALPAFVDGHQHVHLVPQIREEVLDCLEEQGLSGKIWLRDSADHLFRIIRRGRRDLAKALSVAWLGRGFARAAAARGFLTNEGFAGFSAFDPGRDYRLDFERYLRAPGKRHLVMCHPGYCDEELAAADPVTFSRERELAFLLSPAFLEMLCRAGARLVRISEFLSRPA
jgi:predicted glycoside hydrolase/deacetylase ChbG (UPF0249 family)